jgi:type II secretory pathway predicted ATPase ExeA
MYESYFGFRQRPFVAVPTIDRYFPASGIEQARWSTSRCIHRGVGPGVIIGGAGLGKTMACLLLAGEFVHRMDVVLLTSSQICTRRALLQHLLFELQMPYAERSEGALRLALHQRLLPSESSSSEGLVLIVDEAQTLPTKLLDELRLLTNVVHQGIPRVRLVLCGTMKLEDLLSHPTLESLNQRIASRSYLTPMSSYETAQFVKHKIEWAGVHLDQVITADALDALFRASDGIPRLIDQLADHAFFLAFQTQSKLINASLVGQAWSELQQLPNPWSDPQPSQAATFAAQVASAGMHELNHAHHSENLIEFGSLDDFDVVAPDTAIAAEVVDAQVQQADRLDSHPAVAPHALHEEPAVEAIAKQDAPIQHWNLFDSFLESSYATDESEDGSDLLANAGASNIADTHPIQVDVVEQTSPVAQSPSARAPVADVEVLFTSSDTSVEPIDNLEPHPAHVRSAQDAERWASGQSRLVDDAASGDSANAWLDVDRSPVVANSEFDLNGTAMLGYTDDRDLIVVVDSSLEGADALHERTDASRPIAEASRVSAPSAFANWFTTP